MKTIVCYDDNPDFGGHQVMACLAVEALAKCRDLRIVFFFSKKNRRLHRRLAEIQSRGGNLELRITPFATRKLQGLLNRFAWRSARRLGRLIQKESPDLLLCMQGEIEDGSLALCAAQQLKIPCISYIPIPHTMELMGARLGALRDRANRYLFQKPDGWITISESMKTLLQERGVCKPVEVVHNGIDTKRFIPREQNAARTALGLPKKSMLLGTVGRIEFNQKQQDFLVRTFAEYYEAHRSAHLVIVGDGPDRSNLEALIRELNLQSCVSLLPWQDDSALVYSALDLLLIPSRFEGVPLVMLEALACGTPVIASARDGMKDLLPADWTFDAENSEALIKTLRHVSAVRDKQIGALQEKVRRNFTIPAFQKNFEQAVRKFL